MLYANYAFPRAPKPLPMKQTSFSQAEFEAMKRMTRRERLLTEMTEHRGRECEK